MLRKVIGFGLGLCAVAALIQKQWFVGTFLFLLAWVLLRNPGSYARDSSDDTGWSGSDDHDRHRSRDDSEDARNHREECAVERDDNRDDDLCDISDAGDSGGDGGSSD